MKQKILLIDGENILHQSFHKFEKLKSTDGKPSGAIFGFFKSLQMYLNRFEPSKVFITFDNGRSIYRKQLLPEYKAHRKNIAVDYESLQEQKRLILKILGYLRINYVFDKKKTTNYEGDDFLAYLILHKFKDAKYKKILVSSDKDFNQLLHNNDLVIYNPRKEELIRESNCKELFGYAPEETVDYLSMVGDTSDDISGFPGIGPVKARKILDEYGSIKEYLLHHHRTDYCNIAERNSQMIDLSRFLREHPLEKLPIKSSKDKPINYKKFKEVCISYSLSSFMTNEFINTFEKLL